MGITEILLGVAFPLLVGVGLALDAMNPSAGEFLVARLCFGLAATDLAGLVAYWLWITDKWSLPARLLCGAIVGAIILPSLIGTMLWLDGRQYPLGNVAASSTAVPTALEIASAVANRIQPKPEVDFNLVPESKPPPITSSYIPSLILTIRNRGTADIEEVQLIATEYQFALHIIEEPKATRLPDDKVLISSGKSEFVKAWFIRAAVPSLVIDSVAARGSSQPYNLSILEPFKFKFVRLSPSKSTQPLEEGIDTSLHYYALRFSFIDAATQKRYARYRIISCRHPYLLPNDRPGTAFASGGSGDMFHGGIRLPDIIGGQTHDAIGTWTAPGHEDMFTAIPKKILEDQRAMYADSPEAEAQ